MHFNSGYQREALPLLRHFVRVFGDADVVVCPSASCVGMIREFYPRLADLSGDPHLKQQVIRVTGKIYEFTEYLYYVLGVRDVGARYSQRVTYHPTCHALRVLKVGDAPMQLLRHVDGIDLVELDEETECCGFGGTFAIKNAETSAAMLTDKIRHIRNTRAQVCTSVDNSCLMHIGGGLRRLQAGVRTAHLAEILASSGART